MSVMEWQYLLTSNRFGDNKETGVDKSGRTDFDKDCDRITFSSPFRRLGRKTQVHPLTQNDHIHIRLTHSLEVASVGRSLGVMCGKKIIDDLPKGIYPSDIGQILQAASLAHDIGNPPFGHAGEEAIRAWFKDSANADILEGLTEEQRKDFENFEGNAQGFRILTRLEHNVDKGGMRLTCATLGAMLKYPWTSSEIKPTSSEKENGKKFGAFQAEKNCLNDIAEEVQLIKIGNNFYCRHPLALLLEASDDICYRILDLEDAYEMKILSFDEIEKVLKDLCDQDDYSFSSDISNRRKLSFIRTKAIGGAIDGAVDIFVKRYNEIMRGEFKGSIIDDKDSKIKKPLESAYKLDTDIVFKERRKIEIEIGCYSVIGILLNAFCSAVKERISGKKISFKSSRILEMIELKDLKEGDELYESLLKATDYLSGMTDNYASRMAKRIAGMGG